MINLQKQSIKILQELKEENPKNIDGKIKDLLTDIGDTETFYRDHKFAVELKFENGISEVSLNTTYSNQKINKDFIDEMNNLLKLVEEINDYIFLNKWRA